ncbi:MAG: 4Fe-4S dicluster domain-containing protein [Myxococcales bacterium]|nr:4Fe-4S dicluster domain-containing protein [Myxococcales bacterium]
MLGKELGDRHGRRGRLEQAGRATAADAGDDVDRKDVAEQPRPWLLPRLRSQDGPVMLEERELLRSLVVHLRHDLGPELRMRAEHAVVTNHVQPWRRDERGDARAEVERLEDERDRAVTPRLLQQVAKLAAGDLDQALLGDGWATDVPAQPLEASTVPVNATVHSPDGLNEMVYNRCIGTRFCSNNCPYKVRRFNWFDTTRPPPTDLQANPDVRVRERGVMEKCTYCVQRIRRAEKAALVERRAIAPGEVVTACQQACPTGAIQFGSLEHQDEPFAVARSEGRAYGVLHELGTVPRTRYLAKIANPRSGTAR